MGMADGAAYLIREYDLPLKMEDYNDVMWDVITKLYETLQNNAALTVKDEADPLPVSYTHLAPAVPRKCWLFCLALPCLFTCLLYTSSETSHQIPARSDAPAALPSLSPRHHHSGKALACQWPRSA